MFQCVQSRQQICKHTYKNADSIHTQLQSQNELKPHKYKNYYKLLSQFKCVNTIVIISRDVKFVFFSKFKLRLEKFEFYSNFV